MLDLTLAEFYTAEYDESHDVGVYVVKNGSSLYVGMSTSNIWNRWFYGTFRSHLDRDATGTWYGNTSIGREVADNLPDAWGWHIELWRIEDCAEYFADKLLYLGFRQDRLDARTAEQLVMGMYKPILNKSA